MTDYDYGCRAVGAKHTCTVTTLQVRKRSQRKSRASLVLVDVILVILVVVSRLSCAPVVTLYPASRQATHTHTQAMDYTQ